MSESETIQEKTYRLANSIAPGRIGNFEAICKDHLFTSICEIVALAIAEERDCCSDLADEWANYVEVDCAPITVGNYIKLNGVVNK